ncbi:ninja-family protein [Canna indica]|uniref:Ninja-family protein n=1 Tax=Canna indica TaxID=4628 RepID=A0AAQ3KXV2_9LILI|nr:ninja-family protein [Canna indica]
MEFLDAIQNPLADEADGVDLTLSLSVGGNVTKSTNMRSSDGSGHRRRKRKAADEFRKNAMFDSGAGAASADDMAALHAKQSKARDRAVREDGEAFSGDHLKSGSGLDGGNRNQLPSIHHSPNPNSHANAFVHPPFPMMYPYHQVQCVAMPNGSGFPCVVPFWAPAAASVADGAQRFEGNVHQPMAFRSFAGPATTSSCPSNACSNASKGIASAEVENTGSSSSEISSHRSRPIQGGSSSSIDSKSNSISSPRNAEEKRSEAPLREEGTDKLLPSAAQSCNSVSKLNKRIKVADERTGNSSTLLRMPPRVSTTGDGPNGRTIDGFLHVCSKSEISIVCVCHGSSFTPAEFVKHAGGTNISQALRQIVMVRT